MTEYKNRIINSLLFRIITSVIVILLLAGLSLYLFVLRPVSDFVDMNIKENVLEKSREIYNICDRSLNKLLKTGSLNDEKAVRIEKGLTVGMIEDFMRQNNLKGSIKEDGNKALLTGDFPSGLLEIAEKTVKYHEVSSLGYREKKYYVTHTHFSPWEWHIMLIRDAAEYSALTRKVRLAYGVTGFILLMTILLSLYFLNRYTRNPIIRIINPIKDCRKPEYKGIYEFEFLSDIIGQMMEGLEKEANEREKMKEQLLQSQKMEAVGTLAGGIAHDFNNMLQGILGYASLIKMKVKEDDPIYKSVDIIENSAMKAAELTRQLLGFARKGKYVIEPLNLNDTIDNVLKIITKTFDRAIEINTTLKDDLWTVEGDLNQIENVILNLCLNARDSMPAGGLLHIETMNKEVKEGIPYSWEMPGRYAVIKVTDTGRGMDDDVKKRIFEPFFTTKEKGRGTGMGLAMVYGVVKNHDGFITVDSELCKGTTFSVYFPASEKEIKKVENKVKELPHGKGTILIVDDEETVRSFVKEALEALGYMPLEASDGQEAVDIYNSRKCDIALVILDLIMPKMGGDEAFHRLKLINPDVRVLISTGFGIPEKTAEMMKDTGISGFIHKPYNVTEIAETVKKAMPSA